MEETSSSALITAAGFASAPLGDPDRSRDLAVESPNVGVEADNEPAGNEEVEAADGDDG